MRKAALLLSILLTAACQTEVQPIVIDLTARTPTPTTAPIQTPATPLGSTTGPSGAVEISPPVPAVPAAPAPAAGIAPGAPEQIVDAQLGARNRRDLELFLSFFAADAKLYDYPGRLTRSGLDQIRELYARRFEEAPQIRATVTGRIVQGDHIVDQEEVSGLAGGPVRTVAIYEIRNGKIANVWFIR